MREAMPTKVRIESKEEFRRVLAEAIALLQHLARASPDFPPYENIARQLNAMSEWTNGDRVPAVQERESIDIGLVASRELDAYPDPQIHDLCDRLYALDAFFTDFA